MQRKLLSREYKYEDVEVKFVGFGVVMYCSRSNLEVSVQWYFISLSTILLSTIVFEMVKVKLGKLGWRLGSCIKYLQVFYNITFDCNVGTRDHATLTSITGNTETCQDEADSGEIHYSYLCSKFVWDARLLLVWLVSRSLWKIGTICC